MKTISKGESDETEFKESFDSDTIITAGAFGNTRGGSIFIGVTDRGEIRGIPVGLESLKNWSNTISQSTEPRLIPEIESVIIQKKMVAAIHIRENPLKPVAVRGRCYRRVGSSNRMMQPHEIAEQHLRSIGSSWDLTPVPGASLADLDYKSMSWYIAKANETRRRNIGPDEDPESVLEKIGLIQKGIPAWAAILLFGNNPQRFIPQATTHCGLFAADVISVLDDRMVGGTIIDQVNDAIEFVRKNTRVAFVMTGEPERKQVWDYPVDALREAVINAVCHRDYTISSSVEIRIMQDALNIWSPGRLVVGITLADLTGSHVSVARNKGIAQVLYDIGWIERWGSGIQKMNEACAQQGSPLPEFLEDQGFLVEFPKSIFPRDYAAPAGLSEQQIRVVEFIKKHGKITNSQYQMLASVSKRQASEVLAGLETRGVITRVGKTGRGTHYILFKGAVKGQ
ncbi:MAG: helix-turn-helix domain-containing protein [Methanoregula sp.]